MAKARDVRGLQAGDRFDVAAGRVVATRARELFGQADGALGVTDVERVHDMRVASRRLRAVLEIFAPAFRPKALEAVLRDVKALADALGARRDPDVALEQFTRLREALDEPDRPAVDLILERLEAEQAAGSAMLEAALRDARESDLEGRLAKLAAEAQERR